MFQLFGKYRDMANAVKNPCHLNLAACLLKIHRFEEAIGHCTVVSKSACCSTYIPLGTLSCQYLNTKVVESLVDSRTRSPS